MWDSDRSPVQRFVDGGRFQKLFCALGQTFEKLFRGIERALRRAPNFNRAISLICAVRPTFMKSTRDRRLVVVGGYNRYSMPVVPNLLGPKSRHPVL